MDISFIYQYCQNKKGVTEDFPFDQDILVFKIGGKMFLLTSISNWENNQPTINLKCDPDRALSLRDEFDFVHPGYHMNKKHWNTIEVKSSVSPNFIFELIDHSYDLVYKSLSKKIKEEIDLL